MNFLDLFTILVKYLGMWKKNCKFLLLEYSVLILGKIIINIFIWESGEAGEAGDMYMWRNKS